MFVDHIKIFAKAGDGGDGSCSFRREKFVPKGGPDGGDGGRGGSIILVADPHVDNLTAFFYEPIIRAKGGNNGLGKQKYGRAAGDKIVKVPIGTLIYRLPQGQSPFAPKVQEWELDADEEAIRAEAAVRSEEARRNEQTKRGVAIPKVETPIVEPEPEAEGKSRATVGQDAADDVAEEGTELELLADLDREGARLVLCKGGAGGRGNIHFKTARNQVPREFTPGGDGEEGYFLMELRKIADAGLVGYPNAGKSTLLGKLSSAHPKVAPYPFTTLHPIIGVVDFAGYRRAAVADIPGLIEGAHLNVGLGHDFLRHIVRCRVLMFVVDMAGTDGRNPIDDLGQLRKELALYDPLLSERPWFIVANKMDDPISEENLAHFRGRFPKREIVPISADLGDGIEELKEILARHLFEADEGTPAAAAQVD